MALRPVWGRAVWARRPAQGDPQPQGALAAGLHHATGRLAQDGGVGGQQVGPPCPQVEQAVVLPGHLLAGVEAPGEVDRGLVEAPGQVQEDGEAALHVDAPRPPQGVALDAAARRCRPTGGTVSRCPASSTRRRPSEVGPGDDVVAHPLDRQPRAQPQRGLDGVGHRPLVVADRRDPDQRGGQAEQPVGQIAASAPATGSTPRHRRSPAGPGSHRHPVGAQDVVELGLVVALALGQPLSTSTHGQVELATGEVPPTAGLDGHRPRRHVAPAQLVAGLGVDDRDATG